MDKEKFGNVLQMLRASRVKLNFTGGFLDWLVNDFAVNNEDAKNKHFPGLLKEVIENTVTVAGAKAQQKSALQIALDAVAIAKTEEGYRVKGDVADLFVITQALQNALTDEMEAKLRLAPEISPTKH